MRKREVRRVLVVEGFYSKRRIFEFRARSAVETEKALEVLAIGGGSKWKS